MTLDAPGRGTRGSEQDSADCSELPAYGPNRTLGPLVAPDYVVALNRPRKERPNQKMVPHFLQ